MFVRTVIIAGVVIASWVIGTPAHARYYIDISCSDGRGQLESTGAWATYEACYAQVEALRRGPDGTACTFTCVLEGSDGEKAVNMATTAATGVADVFKGPALRTYNTRRSGWPWGRSAIVLNVIPLGVGAQVGAGKPRFALGPASVHLRVLPWISAGAFYGYLYPGDPGAGRDATDVSIYGGSLRVALKGKEMDFKDRGDRSAYYEWYVDLGYGPAVADGLYSGSGRASTAALGLNVTTAWMFGFGLSTGFTYGRIDGATDVTTGEVFDIDVLSWDILMVHLLVIGI